MAEKISELRLVQIWREQSLNGKYLVTEDGELIRIIYPGRINDEPGADFRDAVISTGRRRLTGDIELHVKSGDWYQHRHHRDSNYNRVILHVVMWHDASRAARLENGDTVPVLALSRYLSYAVGQPARPPSYPERSGNAYCEIGQHLPPASIADFLDSAGTERFLDRAAGYRKQLDELEPEEVLYWGIMESLGYSRNKPGFTTLAGQLPLSELMRVIHQPDEESECLVHLQALLIGSAGLLPSQRSDYRWQDRPREEWVTKLEELWLAGYQPAATPVLHYQDWQLFKVRPNNSPVRRLAAMAHLLFRYHQPGMLATLLAIIDETAVIQTHHHLERALMVKSGGYWAEHYDFGLTCRSGNPTLLGGGLARTITVNVLLPFAFAWGEFCFDRQLGRRALEIYHQYPGLPPNAVTRHMAGQLRLHGKTANSARRQQGLIHLYQNLCRRGRCDTCLAGLAHYQKDYPGPAGDSHGNLFDSGSRRCYYDNHRRLNSVLPKQSDFRCLVLKRYI